MYIFLSSCCHALIRMCCWSFLVCHCFLTCHSFSSIRAKVGTLYFILISSFHTRPAILISSSASIFNCFTRLSLGLVNRDRICSQRPLFLLTDTISIFVVVSMGCVHGKCVRVHGSSSPKHSIEGKVRVKGKRVTDELQNRPAVGGAPHEISLSNSVVKAVRVPSY